MIEIKCSYSAANLSVREAHAVLQDFYCYIDDDSYIRLNENHTLDIVIMDGRGRSNKAHPYHLLNKTK